MWTADGQGEPIGSQPVTQGSPFTEYLPSNFDFPDSSSLIYNNIKFDTVNAWQIFDPSTYQGETLGGYDSFSYGSNLWVKATWWKKIERIIYCFDHVNDARTDLNDKVTVGVGHPDNNETGYSFFGELEPVSFCVGSNYVEPNSKTIIINNDRSYTFIAWVKGDLSSVPESHLINKLVIDGRDLCYNLEHASEHSLRFVNCLDQETALFIWGTNMRIIVRTNASSAGIHRWNDSDKIQFELIWYNVPPDAHQSDGPMPFSTGALDNNYIDVDTTDFGYGFYVKLDFVNPQWIEPGYELKGWYFGNHDGNEENFNTSQLLHPENYYEYNTQNCHGEFESPVFFAMQDTIFVTVIYSKSQNTGYTITYYSGI